MPSGVGNSEDEAMKKESAAAWALMTKQMSASVFFGVSSIAIITVNKAVLTTFQFVQPLH